MVNKRLYLIIACSISAVVLAMPVFAGSNIEIQIASLTEMGEIDAAFLGTSILGWETDHGRAKKPHAMGSDYCYGLWDNEKSQYVQEAFQLAKDIKIGSLRLIGQFTDWEKGLDIFGEREYAFGLNEQLGFAHDIGAEPIICLQNLDLEESYSRLFEFLKEHWPRVTYVEIGNESYDFLSAEEYAKKYLHYYAMLKKINPDLQIGFVGRDVKWEAQVMAIIGDRFDFIVEHYYPHGGKNNDLRQKGEKVFSELFPKIGAIEKNIQNTLDLMEVMIGERKPIAVTEYNAWFVQERPVPYRHTLGTALVNAELLRIFMRPENNILTANIWNLINEYWGMIANGFNGQPGTLYDRYYKRPNYLLFEMYTRYFGDHLLEHTVSFKDERTNKELLDGISWTVRDFKGVDVENEADELSLVFDVKEKGNYYHTSKVVSVSPDTEYRLSGYIKTEDLLDDFGICLEFQDGRGWNKTQSASSSKRISGTTGWSYVEAYYKTLPDAQTARVIIRRIGDTGPIHGKVRVKDVALEKMSYMQEIKEADISVNTSTNQARDTLYIMVTNMNVMTDIPVTVSFNDFIPNGKAEIHYLWGKKVDATNERRPHDDVRIYDDEVEFEGNSFEYTFKKHSLTAIVIHGSTRIEDTDLHGLKTRMSTDWGTDEHGRSF